MTAQEKSAVVAIIDDDELIRIALQDLLATVGFPSEMFSSAEDFLKSGRQHHVACLLVDVRMPGISGLELQAKLKAESCRIPIIFITAHGDAAMRMQALRDGAVEFLQKPFDDDVLLHHVKVALGK